MEDPKNGGMEMDDPKKAGGDELGHFFILFIYLFIFKKDYFYVIFIFYCCL